MTPEDNYENLGPRSQRHQARSSRSATTRMPAASRPARSGRAGSTGPKKPKSTLSKVLLGIGAVLIVLLGAVAGWGIYRYIGITNKMKPASAADAKAVQAAVTPASSDPNAPIYILLLGEDARPGQRRARSDSIIIARIDRANKNIQMLSIPRDSRVPIAGHGLDKITHANAFGGPALAIDTVKNYTGLPINHYIELNFEGFVSIVKALGGVTVQVDRAINDSNGSNTGGVSNVTSIPAGLQRLNAQQALTFVRSRAYANGDFTRIKNQQRFLIALAKEAFKTENIMKLPNVADSAAGNIKTDMSVPDLMSLAQQLKGLDTSSIRGATVPGSTGMMNGVSYVFPYEDKAKALFKEFEAGNLPVATTN